MAVTDGRRTGRRASGRNQTVIADGCTPKGARRRHETGHLRDRGRRSGSFSYRPGAAFAEAFAALQGFADGAAQALGVEAQVGEEFVALGVLDELIGDAEADDVACVETGGVGGLKHGAAEAAFERA